MEKNQSILIFTDKYPFSKSEPFFKEELDFISNSFYKVTIQPFESGGSEAIRTLPEGVHLLNPVFNRAKNKGELIIKGAFNFSPFRIFLKEILKMRIWKSASAIYTWFTYILIIRTLIAFSKRKQWKKSLSAYDVLYFYWGLRWSQILPFLPDDLTAKIVVRFHGSDLYENPNRNMIPFREKQLRKITLAVFVSEMGKDYLAGLYPFLKDKCLVARIGTDDYGLNPYQSQNKIHLVTCSNLVPVKRVYLVAQSLAFIDFEITWTHIGDGVQMNEIKELVKSLPDHIQVNLRGIMSHDDLMDFYKHNTVHLFLNVSSSEGIPVSVMEALSFGIPVLATNVGGTYEIVNEKVGQLLEPDITPAEISGKIKEILFHKNYVDSRHNARNQWEKLCRADQLYPQFMSQLKRLMMSSPPK